MPGYMGKLLRVNLSEMTSKIEPIDEQIKRLFMGPRGFGAFYLYRELAPGIDPLSAENKLVFGAAVLGGTIAQGFSKGVVMGKSPATGAIAKSVIGSNIGPYLKFAGFDIVIIEGKAAAPCYIHIVDGECEIIDGIELWGLNTKDAQSQLRKKYGSHTAVACIGPAGEKLVKYASIMSDMRAAGRCGLGTVMGAKNLKAVAVNGTGRVPLRDKQNFKLLAQDLVQILKTNERRALLTEFGTASSLEKYHNFSMIPVRNFREGKLEGIKKIVALEFNRFKVKNYGCWGCMTRCGQVRQVNEGEYVGYLTEGPEYESIFAFGPNLCNTDPASIIAADSICNLYGLDVISAGVSISFACELLEKNIITKSEADKLELTWGNHRAFVTLLKKIGKREGFGGLLGEGTKQAANQIGRGAEKYAMHVKGLEMPGYEPRAIKGYALSYATSNIGGSHMYGRPTEELLKKIDPLADEGKGEYIASVQKEQAVMDCILECPFGDAGLTPDLRNQMLVAATGFQEFGDPAYLTQMGERIVTLERAFNVREGFSRKDDTLPSRFLREPLENAGVATGETVRKLDVLLNEYYETMGYTRDGIPTNETLSELKLKDIVGKMK